MDGLAARALAALDSLTTAEGWTLAAGYPVRPDGSSRWYWSVDATPLFLVVAAMAGAGGPAVGEALGWLERALQPTGLLTYAGHPRGLEHQGWRDATPARPRSPASPGRTGAGSTRRSRSAASGGCRSATPSRYRTRGR